MDFKQYDYGLLFELDDTLRRLLPAAANQAILINHVHAADLVSCLSKARVSISRLIELARVISVE